MWIVQGTLWVALYLAVGSAVGASLSRRVIGGSPDTRKGVYLVGMVGWPFIVLLVAGWVAWGLATSDDSLEDKGPRR